MKKIFIFLSVFLITFNLMADDWRMGKYLKTVPEYFLSVNANGKKMIGTNSELNPWGYGFTIEYLYKTGRKSDVKTSVAHGIGGHLGFSYFKGVDVTQEAIGANNPMSFDKFNSYNYMPIMLTYNFFITSGSSHFILGLDAGVNMMIREKDYKEEDFVTRYDGLNSYKITRFIPSASGYIGYMYELTTNIRIKGKVGADYIMGYKFDGFKEEYILNNSNQLVSKEFRGKVETKGLINVSASIGLAYSL